MIRRKEKKQGVTIYYLSKLISDDKLEGIKGKNIKPSMIRLIIDNDAEVYGEDDQLLLVFRKGKIPNDKLETFYENLKQHVKTGSSNRFTATGNRGKRMHNSKKVMTTILGFFDGWTPTQKNILNRNNISRMIPVRETLFNREYPERYKKVVPLIQKIDALYKQYLPLYYKSQHKTAMQTPFRIADTSFTTVTINGNFQTSIHKDSGDYPEGFGNLAVIENGEYTGAETCFPQYGIGVNVRQGDILFMDVHQYHGNLPIHISEQKEEIARMSIVCYLRLNIWKHSKGKTKKYAKMHINKYNNTKRAHI